LRYPGGKSRAVKQLLRFLPSEPGSMVSPFLGGGSFELAAAARGWRVHGYVREIYEGYTVIPLEWKYGMSRNKQSREIILLSQVMAERVVATQYSSPMVAGESTMSDTTHIKTSSPNLLNKLQQAAGRIVERELRNHQIQQVWSDRHHVRFRVRRAYRGCGAARLALFNHP